MNATMFHKEDVEFYSDEIDPEKIYARAVELMARRQSFLRKDGRIPYAGPNRDAWDTLNSRADDLKIQWALRTQKRGV